MILFDSFWILTYCDCRKILFRVVYKRDYRILFVTVIFLDELVGLKAEHADAEQTEGAPEETGERFRPFGDIFDHCKLINDEYFNISN